MTAVETRTAHDVEADALIALYVAAADALDATGTAARAGTLTSRHTDAFTAASDELRAACEAFRARHYPGRARVVAREDQVLTVSRTALSIRTVYERNVTR